MKVNMFAGWAGSIAGALFAEALIEKMRGMSRVYYARSGSEAKEKVFKMVRQIGHRGHGGRKTKILYRERDYHGTTITALSAGGQPQRNAQYGPFTPGFVEVPHCPYIPHSTASSCPPAPAHHILRIAHRLLFSIPTQRHK